MALQRPLKEGNVRTYQEKVTLNFLDILASEADGDHDTMYAAWNGALGGDLTGTLPNPTITAAAKSKWSDSGTTLTPVNATRTVTVPGDASGVAYVAGLPTAKTRLFGHPTAGVTYVGINARLTGGASPSWASDDAAKPAWVLNLRTDLDNFLVSRFPAGSTTGANLLTVDSLGNLTLTGGTVNATPRCGVAAQSFAVDLAANSPATMAFDSSKNMWLWELNYNSNFTTLYHSVPGASASWVSFFTIDGSANLSINGNTGTKASGTTWANPSDPRLKDDVASYAAGLAEICQLAPISYRLKADPTRECYGFDARAVRDVFPECVSTTRMKLDPADEEETDDVLVFDMHPILVALVNAVRELAAKVAP